jgi:hypothetical protein|tara:strand:+ start:10192 stop:10434 length:243 start_codon:yes stop_codon:yes gene_type:complete
MATLLRTDGTQKKDISIVGLKRLQDLVGGYIEVVNLTDGRILIVNEEGLLLKLPFNEQASDLSSRPLVGDVILCKNSELN